MVFKLLFEIFVPNLKTSSFHKSIIILSGNLNVNYLCYYLLFKFKGRSVKDWAMLNPNPKKRMQILEFLDKTKLFAMSGSGHDLLMRKASSKTLSRYS